MAADPGGPVSEFVDPRPWIEVGSGHRIWLADDGTVASWSHPRPDGSSHEVAPITRSTWTVVAVEPLTLSPSLYCDPSRGGCGTHGFVRNGAWS